MTASDVLDNQVFGRLIAVINTNLFGFRMHDVTTDRWLPVDEIASYLGVK